MFSKVLDRIARNFGYFTSAEIQSCVRSSEEEALKYRLPLGDEKSNGEVLNSIALNTAMRALRLHGFALVYYGGNVLHQAVGAPTEQRSWKEDLSRATRSIAGQGSEQPLCLAAALEDNLFDLNSAGAAGIEVARMISSGRKA
jgi:hypothetical protein